MDRFYRTAFTVPAGTAAASPHTGTFAMDSGNVGSLWVMVPSGHCGLTGLIVTYQGTQIAPWGGSGPLISDDETVEMPYNDYVMSPGFGLSGYNTDIFDHTFYLRAAWTAPGAAAAVAVVAPQASPLVPDDTMAAISSLAGGGLGGPGGGGGGPPEPPPTALPAIGGG